MFVMRNVTVLILHVEKWIEIYFCASTTASLCNHHPFIHSLSLSVYTYVWHPLPPTIVLSGSTVFSGNHHPSIWTARNTFPHRQHVWHSNTEWNSVPLAQFSSEQSIPAGVVGKAIRSALPVSILAGNTSYSSRRQHSLCRYLLINDFKWGLAEWQYRDLRTVRSRTKWLYALRKYMDRVDIYYEIFWFIVLFCFKLWFPSSFRYISKWNTWAQHIP